MVLYSFESLCQVLLNQNEVTSTFMDIYFLADITKSFPMNLSIYRRALGETFTIFLLGFTEMTNLWEVEKIAVELGNPGVPN